MTVTNPTRIPPYTTTFFYFSSNSIQNQGLHSLLQRSIHSSRGRMEFDLSPLSDRQRTSTQLVRMQSGCTPTHPDSTTTYYKLNSPVCTFWQATWTHLADTRYFSFKRSINPGIDLRGWGKRGKGGRGVDCRSVKVESQVDL